MIIISLPHSSRLVSQIVLPSVVRIRCFFALLNPTDINDRAATLARGCEIVWVVSTNLHPQQRTILEKAVDPLLLLLGNEHPRHVPK